MKVIGLVLIVLGIIGLAYGGVTWTHRDKVVDLGPLQVTTEKHERVPLPPVAGGVCLVTGAALMLASGRKTALRA